MAKAMAHRFSQLTFTPSVVRMQQQFGTAARVHDVSQRLPENDRFSQREVDFIQARDSFYMASVSEDDWPYIQHRGGEAGFLRVVDATSLVFFNYSGNGQYQSMGNLAANNRVALFLISYPQRRRLKILGRAELFSLDNLPDDLACLRPDIASAARVESVIRIQLQAFDWNCPQYITPRYTEAEFAEHRGAP